MLLIIVFAKNEQAVTKDKIASFERQHNSTFVSDQEGEWFSKLENQVSQDFVDSPLASYEGIHKRPIEYAEKKQVLGVSTNYKTIYWERVKCGLSSIASMGMGNLLEDHNGGTNVTENNLISHDALKVRNMTAITEIVLLGFPSFQQYKVLTFCLLLGIYCMTICGNLMIILLVSKSKNLHSPMYIFLTQLSVCDMLLTTDIVPNMLYIVLIDKGRMSLLGCITQYLFFCSSECSECLLLTVMSYDRYLAICKPLHYNAIMNQMFCVKLVIICWAISYLGLLNQILTLCTLWFCGPNVIDHFFCDITPLLELSCSDTFVIEFEDNMLTIPLISIPFLIIIISYVYIVLTILKIPTLTGRHKAFSTCSSHLAVVSIFYGALTSIYSLPTKTKSHSLSKLLSLLYTVVTPLINPIIYSFRNKDIKEAFKKYI
ncbi:olfactory receptor 5G3-like [Pseudophryne corroboree]|uniref:olfactory receptor 5G3-like n=1 Tax=Pseudophryne corroboree TaxID=495146 RepID=UPI0030812B33